MLISTNISRGAVESSEISSNLSRIELSSSYIEEQMDMYEDFLFTALVDEKLVPSITTNDNVNSSNAFNTQSYITDKLFELYNRNEHVMSVSLVSFEDHQLYLVENNDFYVSNYLQSPKKVENKYAIFDVDSVTDSFSFARNIYRFEDQKLVGQLKIQTNFSFMNHIAENLQSNEGEYVLLLNTGGKLLFNPGKYHLNEKVTRKIAGTSNKYIEDDRGYYFFQEIVDKQIILVKYVPEEVMMVGAVYIGRSGAIILFVSIILTIILSIIVSNQVSKPIIALSKTMEYVEENNFHVLIETKRTDEIGILHHKFKEMIIRIRELIDKDYKREMENRDAQFLALQAQINPHFLYNTLQVVGGMALKKNAKEIYTMTQRLALMFRYITNKRGDLVYIREEVSHLKNYLYIQKVRFGDRVSIHLYVDESVNNALIPLLSLQPIIENSFKHGFESMIEKGCIKIDIQSIFNEIEIVIEDNGVGIPKEALTELKDKLTQDIKTENRSIGLKNVDGRIKLYFGNEYGLDVFSKESEYTRIMIRIPKREKGENG